MSKTDEMSKEIEEQKNTMEILQELENNLNMLAKRCVKTTIAVEIEHLKQPIIFKFISILKENKANKKRIEKLEEENTIYRKQLNSAFDRGFIHKDKIKEELEIATKKYKDYKKELENNSNLSMQTWKHYGEKYMCEKLLGIEKNITTLD